MTKTTIKIIYIWLGYMLINFISNKFLEAFCSKLVDYADADKVIFCSYNCQPQVKYTLFFVFLE